MNYLLIDIGNSATKLGYFSGESQKFLTLPRQLADWDRPLRLWSWSVGLASNESQCQTHVSCVCPEQWDRLRPLLSPTMNVKLWADKDIPIEVEVDNKNAVGSDRLFASLYASTVKAKKRPALVCNIGTAQTVDVLSPDGKFMGGQIIPGISSGFAALHIKTAFLPKIDMLPEDMVAKACGKNTRQAMEFGAINLACGILERMKRLVKKEYKISPSIFISGGAGKLIWKNLDAKAVYVEQMTINGMYVVASSGKELRVASCELRERKA